MNKTAKPFTGLCTRSLFCYSHTHSHTCTHANTNTNTNTNRRYASQVLLCSGLFCDPNGCCTLLATMVAAAQAARRGRERRLRAYLRYAWMSVAMALADGKAREEDRDVHYTAAFRTTDDPPEPELFDLFEEPGGARPVFLTEPPGESQGGAGHGHQL